MAGNSKRAIVRLESTAGTGYRYTVTKNKSKHPDKLEYRKFDPVARKHVLFKEIKYIKNPIKFVITSWNALGRSINVFHRVIRIINNALFIYYKDVLLHY